MLEGLSTVDASAASDRITARPPAEDLVETLSTRALGGGEDLDVTRLADNVDPCRPYDHSCRRTGAPGAQPVLARLEPRADRRRAGGQI